MKELRYTLLADGSSDDALLPVLTWLLLENGVECALSPNWADFAHLRELPKRLVDRIRMAIALYPCDLLFIHRDAERQDPSVRYVEIRDAMQILEAEGRIPPAICVVPVRMTEAWLLFDEATLRRAAGNPNGHVELQLPRLKDLESDPDPKETLFQLLRTASQAHGRRLDKFDVRESRRRVASLLEDVGFSPLRTLTAFRAMEEELTKVLHERRWICP